MLRALSILASFYTASADIFEHDKHVLNPGQPILERNVGMFTKEDSPGDADKDPYIKFDLTIEVAKEGHGFVEVIVVQAHELDEIGLYSDVGVKYCCTPELMARKIPGCDTIDTLIIRPLEGINVKRFRANFNGNEKTIKSNGKYMVETTGEHLLLTSTCFADMGKVEVSGKTEWMNPYGYLPGSSYGHLPFYSAMSVLYMVMGVFWLCLNGCYWREVITVQIYITVTLGLCMLEMGVWYFDYNNLNNTGIRHFGMALFGVAISSMRRTISRMLIVAVSLGFGVCRPSLGKNKAKMAILGAAYFVCDVAMESVVRYSQTNEHDVDERARVVLSLLVSVTNTMFYFWTFTALNATQTTLTERNQHVKLALYQKFTKVLVASIVGAVIFAIYTIWFMSTDQMQTRWSQRWLLDSGMEVIMYTVILVSIAVLWRPTKNNQRYAYAQVGGDVDLDSVELIVRDNKLPTPKFELSDSDDDDVLSSDDDATLSMANSLKNSRSAKLE